MRSAPVTRCILGALLCSPMARAADPPPATHLRSVEATPTRWSHLHCARRPVTLYWNGGPLTVEMSATGNWQTLAADVPSGWTSSPLPRGVRFRLTDGNGWYSEVSETSPVATPAQVAALGGPHGRILGRNVVDIEVAPDGRPWAASLEGGLTRLDPTRRRVQSFTVADGLPSNRVVAVAPGKDVVWVATAAGLARMEPLVQGMAPTGRWTTTYMADVTDGLPDSYIQSLAIDHDKLWVGTYHGLAFSQPDGSFRTLLRPWSVFSLVRASDQRFWVGYEGLRGLPDAEPIEGIPTGVDVYDIEPLGLRGHLLATLQQGLVFLWEGQLTPVWNGRGDDGAYAIAPAGDRYLAAGAAGGMVTVDPNGQVEKIWSLEDGLPTTVIHEVIQDVPRDAESWDLPQGTSTDVWLGTDHGVTWLDTATNEQTHWPGATLAGGTEVRHVERRFRKLRFAGREGLFVAHRGLFGRSHQVEAAGTGLVTSLRHHGHDWWVYEDRILQRRGIRSDVLHRIPWKVHAATVAGGALWVGGEGGLVRFDPSIDRFVPLEGLGPVRQLREGDDGVLWVIAGGVVTALFPDLSNRPYLATREPLDLWPDGKIVWVGTENGLEVIQVDTGEVLGLLRTSDRKVRVPALAADGIGGCWIATDSGQVLHLDTTLNGGAAILTLDRGEPPEILAIQPARWRSAWVFTDQGPYVVRLPQAP